MTLEEEYAILSYLPLSRRANISANIIANISARKKTEDRGGRRKTETQRIFTLGSKGAPRRAPPPLRPKFSQFHVVFRKIWQNRMLAPPYGEFCIRQ